jgi:hypothetical protein
MSESMNRFALSSSSPDLKEEERLTNIGSYSETGASMDP